MSNERRYGDDEVAEIFALAARADGPAPRQIPAETGLTLRELQEIGTEAGIDPVRIAEAARTLTVPGSLLPQKKFLGAPLSVGQVVDLPRPLSSREWDILVGDLRDTFAATGRLRTVGGGKEWANGNLRVLLEPTETGQRLRLSTLNGRFRLAGAFGIVGLTVLAVLLPTVFGQLLLEGGLNAEALEPLVVAAVAGAGGAGSIAWARNRLPSWARERSAQMDTIAHRVLELAERTPPAEPI